MTVRQPGSAAPTNHIGKGVMSSPHGKRKTRTVIAAAVAVAAGAAGIGLSSRTVSVANSWDSG